MSGLMPVLPGHSSAAVQWQLRVWKWVTALRVYQPGLTRAVGETLWSDTGFWMLHLEVRDTVQMLTEAAQLLTGTAYT